MKSKSVPDGAEFEVVLGVFRRIARQSWFRNDPATLDKFGRAVLNAHQSGIRDPEELHAHCLQVAKVMLPARGE